MTVAVDIKAGRERLEAERRRVARLLARSTPIEGCGPAIPIAPARGPQVVEIPHMVLPDEKSGTGYKIERTGWRGFAAVREADIFDDLTRRAALRKDKDGRPGQSPFSKGQVAVARRYRDLVERHEGAGIKCASLEVRAAAGPAGGGSFIDAYIDEGREIAWLRQQIGAGAAMSVRRVRPSARGGAQARTIRDRDLVDAICLRGSSFRAVLSDHGWSPDGKHVKALLVALCGCLDRMQGHSAQLLRKRS